MLLIVCDTLRADHLSLYGYGRETAPNLARRARGGIVVPRAYSQYSVTWPTLASLATGRSFGDLRGTGEFVLLSEATAERPAGLQASTSTLAELVTARGISTVAVVANPLIRRGSGFDQGFETYLDTLQLAGVAEERMKVGGEAVSRAALGAIRDAIRTAPGRPFFAWVHYFDPHRPYLPSAEDLTALGLPEHAEVPAVRDGMAIRRDGSLAEFLFPEEQEWLDAGARARLVDLYDAEIRHFDRGLEELLGGLEREGILATTEVWITADHGEAFYEEGFWGHGLLSKAPEEWVPLIRLPAAGGAMPSLEDPESPVSTTDLFFTILNTFGVPLPDADSLLPWTADLASGSRRFDRVFSEGQNVQILRSRGLALYRYEGIEEHHAAVSARGLLSVSNGLALFDLEKDADERFDLFRTDPDRALHLARTLVEPPHARHFLRRARDASLGLGTSSELRALGYLR